MKTPVPKPNKAAGFQAGNLFKKSFQYRRFPVNITKFLRTAFLNRTPLVAASIFGSVIAAENTC